MDVSDWSLRGAKLVGSLLLFCNIEHCSAKKGVKKFRFLVKIGNKTTILVKWGNDRDFLYQPQNFLKWTNRL